MESVLVILFLLFVRIDPLDSLVTLWNAAMDWINSFLTLDVLNSMLSGTYSSVFKNIVEAMQVVGYALTILLWLYGILRVESTLAEMKRPEAVFKHMLRLIIMIWLVQYAPEIVKAIWDIGLKLAISTRSDIGIVGVSGAANFHLPTDLFSQFADPTGGDGTTVWTLAGQEIGNIGLPLTMILALLCVVVNIGSRIVILLVVYQIFSSIITRFFRLLLLYMVSPLAASGCASEETQRISVQFAKNVIATSAELALTTLLLRIFKFVTVFVIKDNGLTGLNFVGLISRIVQEFLYGVMSNDRAVYDACTGTFCHLTAVTLLFVLLLFTLKASIRGLNSIIDSLFGLHGV